MSAKTKKILSKAFSIVLSLTMILGIMMPLVRVDSVAEATSSVSSSSEPSTETNLSLFNSGLTSNATWREPNPAPDTYSNGGYDIYASISREKRVRLGLSFKVEADVTERSTLSISAYDVDEDMKDCGHGYEYDYIYLVDETAGSSIKLDGHMSGQSNTWNNSVFSIIPSYFTTGHTYHFEIEMTCTGSTSCTYYTVKVRTVSLQLGIAGASAPTNDGIESADLSASISSSGVVSVALSAKAYESGSYTVEYKAVYSSNSAQKGGTQQTVTIPTTSTTFNSTFNLESGAPRGTYVITAFIKDGSGNVKATREITVSYGYLAVSYNSNGGSQNLPVDLNAYGPADEVTVLFDYIPSRAGYTFLGWSFYPDDTAPCFAENGATSFSIASDVVLYAVWAEESSEPTEPSEPSLPSVFDTWDGGVASGFGGGSGYESDPYLIYTASELAYLAYSVNSGNSYAGKYFKLMNNIDLSDREWTPIGKGSLTSDLSNFEGVFSGHFDGNGCKIINLSITANNTSYSGLFGFVSNGSITNLGIEIATINVSISGQYRSKCGALAGRISYSVVSRCYVTGGNVTTFTSNNPSSSGVLLGNSDNATIEDCYAEGTSISNGHVAILVGSCYDITTISRCYAIGEAKNQGSKPGGTIVCAGGIIGHATSSKGTSVNNCFVVGSVSSNVSSGILVADNATTTGCYYYREGGNSNVTIDNLKSESWVESNLGWDFSSVWMFDGVSEYPTLQGFGASDPIPPAPPITCTHEESELIVDTASTCTESGAGHTECTLCGEVLSTIIIPANNHSYYVAAELAETCTTNGYVLFACYNCSYTRTQVIYATGHDFGGDHICDECGYEVESHTHDYTVTVVAPTCTTLGYTVYDCACGHSYRVDYIDQTGHRWNSGEVTVSRTCTTDGIITYTCTLCYETRTEILPAGHDWSETVTVEKTCETDGEITKTCNNCGETETEVIPAGHTWSEGVIITEATCTEPGSEEVTCQICGTVETHETDVLGHTFVNGRCTRCGAGIDDVVTPNEGHPEYGMYFEIDDILSNYGPDKINEYGVLLDYNEGANIKKVGVYLVQDGTMWRRCIACVGEGITYATYVPYLSYDEDIKYTGLNSPYINIFRLKENSDGIWCYSNYATIGVNLQDAYGNLLLSLYDIGQAGAKTRVFDNLDEMIEWLKEPVSGDHTHKESEWLVDIVPTCVMEGQRHKECTACGEILATEAIPTIDHTVGEWITDKEPTCLEEGSQHTECTVCLTVIETVAIPTVNHTESEWIVKVAPTCIESGYQHKECTVCHNILLEEYLPSTGVHAESEWIITTEPTTTSQGEKYKECSVCHTILSVETIPALAKIKVNGVVSRAGYTVNVTIDIQNNPGILGAILTMKYDSRLTLIGVNTGAAWNTLTFTEPGAYTSECNFVWDGDMVADYNNGTIITLTFEIPYDAMVGDIFAIDLSYTEGNIVGEDLTPAEIYIENGNIVVDNIRGDVNDDGIVDVADIIALRRYMAGGYNIDINVDQSDLNDDGIITILDIIQLREYILSI